MFSRCGLPVVASEQERLLEQAWLGLHRPWGSLKDLPQRVGTMNRRKALQPSEQITIRC